MDYKDKFDKEFIEDLISESELEQFEKATKIVALIGESFPALSLDILAKLVMLCAMQYDMTKENLTEFQACLSNYIHASTLAKEKIQELDEFYGSNKTLH